MAERPASLEISEYARECIREDEEFILYRAHANTAEVPSILLLTPASMRPRLESLKKIEHEYSLRRDFDSAWAVRPIALSQWNGREALVLEDPVVSFSIVSLELRWRQGSFAHRRWAFKRTRPVTQA